MKTTYYRNILASDFAAIEAFEDTEAIDSFTVECLQEMFERGENDFAHYSGLVACDETGGVIGYVIYFELTQYKGRSCIIRCFVSPEARRDGVGAELISRSAPTKTGNRVTIEIELEDYASAAFLRKNGYTVVEVVDAEYDEEGEMEMEGFMIMSIEKRPKLELSQRIKWRAK